VHIYSNYCKVKIGVIVIDQVLFSLSHILSVSLCSFLYLLAIVSLLRACAAPGGENSLCFVQHAPGGENSLCFVQGVAISRSLNP